MNHTSQYTQPCVVFSPWIWDHYALPLTKWHCMTSKTRSWEVLQLPHSLSVLGILCFVSVFLFFGGGIFSIAASVAFGSSWAGVELELQLPASTTYTTACGNAGSLTHWVRPGIESASLWILVGFLTCWSTIGTPDSLFWKSAALKGEQLPWHYHNVKSQSCVKRHYG